MIYFLTGLSARSIKLKEIEKDFDSITRYDANVSEEYDKFLSDITNVSIFSQNELLVLKRAEKLKTFTNLISILKNYKNNNKSILIDYEYEYKNNPYILPFKNIEAEIINIEKEEDLIIEFLCKYLKITKKEAKEIISLVGTDYNHIKNEVYKYRTYLLKESFSIEKIRELMYVKDEIKNNEIMESIYNKTFDISKLKDNNYMITIYTIYKEFEILHKLNIFNLSTDYNIFKEEFKKYEKYFSINYYQVYLKNKNINFSVYNKNKCMNVLKKCNEVEYKIKTGLLDMKTALWLVVKEIYE